MKNTVEDAFRKVLKRYEDGINSRYICANLNHLTYHGYISASQEVRARVIVNNFLDGYSSLESWLEAKHDIPCDELYSNHDKITQTRINWLKYLIKYCKKNNL